MDDRHWLAEQFESNRAHLRGVAYRMLGSLSEAEDAVQEAWLRLNRSDTSEVENLGGWLTTVVARVSLDMLRSRKARNEEAMGVQLPDAIVGSDGALDPENEALLADSVGLALLVVLEKLDPAERLAFVLHDLFAMPFDEIGSIVGRTSTAARQLASRARRRVQGTATVRPAALAQQRRAVDAFLSALRSRDFNALVAVLDPNAVIHVDAAASPTGAVTEVQGAENWAKQAIAFARGARHIQAALVNGAPGVILAPRGRLRRVLQFTFVDGKIARIDIIADPAQLSALEVAVL
jgi:RNA polymerase sigma factor (sigma-70 family)